MSLSSEYINVTADPGAVVLEYMLSKPSLSLIFGEGFTWLSSDADETSLSEAPTPTPTRITTSLSSSKLLSQLKTLLARKGLQGKIKSPSDLQSLVDILAEGGMMTSLRGTLLLYCHRSS